MIVIHRAIMNPNQPIVITMNHTNQILELAVKENSYSSENDMKSPRVSSEDEHSIVSIRHNLILTF